MTPLERAIDCLVKRGSTKHMPALEMCIADTILQAILEEREACAKIAENIDYYSGDPCSVQIADAIRDRGYK